MDQMARAHPGLGAAERSAKVDPVVQHFIDREPGQGATVKNRPFARAKGCADKHWQQRRQPCAKREDRARVAMVNVVDRSHESREPMAHPAVDRILKEAPGDEACAEKSDKSENSDGTNRARHTNMVEPRTTPAQSACANDGCPATPHRRLPGWRLPGEAAAAWSSEGGGRLLNEAFLIYWMFGSAADSSGTRSDVAGEKGLAAHVV